METGGAMSNKYENELVDRECETADAAIERLVETLRSRGVRVADKEIKEARRAASMNAVMRYFG